MGEVGQVSDLPWKQFIRGGALKGGSQTRPAPEAAVPAAAPVSLLGTLALAFVGGLSRNSLAEIAASVAKPLGWDKVQQFAEVVRAEELLLRLHRVTLGEPGLAPLTD